MKKILSLHKFFLPFFFSFLIFDSASATDYYWHPSSGTTWGTLANWRTGSYSGSSATILPTSSDNVFIGNSTTNFTVDLNINDTINNLSITDGGQIFINTSASKVLYVMGNLTSSNSATTGGGSATIRMKSSGSPSLTGNSTATGKGKLCNLIIDISGTVTLSNYITMGGSTTLTYNAGTVSAGTSTVAFYSANTISGSFTFYDLQFLGTSGTFTINNNQTVTHSLTTSGSSSVVINSSTIDIEGDINIDNSSTASGGSTTFNLTGSNNQTITSSVSAAQGYLPNVKLSKSSGTVTFSGAFSVYGNWENNYSADTSVLIFGTSTFFIAGNGSVTHTIGGTKTTSFYDVTIGFSGHNNTYDFTKDTAMIVRHLFRTNGSSLNVTMNNHSFLVKGNIQIDNVGTQGGGTSLLILGGGSDQTITSSVGLAKGFLPKVKIEKSAGTLSFIGNISIDGDLTNNYSASTSVILYGTASFFFNGGVTVGGSYSLPIYRFYISGSNNFTISMGRDSALIISDSLVISGTAVGTISGYSLVAKGCFVNNNTNSNTAITSTVYLKGSSTQYVKGTNNLKVSNWVLNKSAGTVTLNKTLTVTGSVTFTNGNIVSSSTNLLIFNDNATVTGASDNSFVSGPVKKIGNDPFKFCIGKSSSYKPDSISAPSSTTDAFTSEYFSSAHGTTTTDTSLTYLSKCEYWNIDRTTGTSNVKIKLYWNSSTCDIYTLSTLKIARLESGTWKSIGAVTTSGSTTTGNIISNSAQSTFGYYTIGKKSPVVYANAGTDAAICYSASATLGGSPTATGGLTAYTYTWSPSTGLSSVTVANPTASPTATTTYTVTVTDLDHSTATDAVVVTVNPKINISAGGDKILCPGGDAYFGSAPTASGGTGSLTYSWSPSTGLDTATIANPHCTTTVTTSYILTVTDANSCAVHDTVTVTVSTPVVAHAGNDTTVTAYAHVKLGATVTATGGSGNYTFMWYQSTHIDSPTIARPIAKILRTDTFTLHVIDEYSCNADDEIIVSISNPIAKFDSSSGSVYFMENKGQVIDTSGTTITSVKYQSKLFNATMFVRDTAITLMYSKIDTAAAVVDSNYIMNILFDNANTNSLTAEGNDTLPTRVNYYSGTFPQYYENVRTVRYIAYSNMYSGIDAYLFNTGGEMNWHFIIDTTGNPSDISFFFQGADSVYADSLGDALVTNLLNNFWWATPFVTQNIAGRIDTITGSYSISGSHLGLSLSSYNHHYPVDIYLNKHDILPPPAPPTGIICDWSTYFGGNNNDISFAVSNTTSGGLPVFDVGGYTKSTFLPTPDISFGFFNHLNSFSGGLDNFDAFVAQFSFNQRELLYLTFFGSGPGGGYSGRDELFSLTIGPMNRTYFCGRTYSTTLNAATDFPIFNNSPNLLAFQQTAIASVAPTDGTGYVVALQPNLTGYWSTCLGQEGCYGLAIDNTQTATPQLIVVGRSQVGDLNTQSYSGGTAYSNLAGSSGMDGTIMQFDIKTSTFGNLEWSTYFGGVNIDYNWDVAVDSWGRIGITGITHSSTSGAYPDFPITNAVGAQPVFGGGYNDAYLALFNKHPNRNLLFCTYIGGGGSAGAGNEGISSNNSTIWQPVTLNFYPSNASIPKLCIVTGKTNSSTFPVQFSGGQYGQASTLGEKGFIQTYDLNGVTYNRIYSTNFGGNGQTWINKVTSTPHDLYFTGVTASSAATFPLVDFSTVTGHTAFYQNYYAGGSNDGFIARMNFSMVLQWSTFFGGSLYDACWGINYNPKGIFVCGHTQSHGASLDINGQPVPNNFPLQEYDSSTPVDYWQQYQNCPVNNANFPCMLINPPWDGFISSFNDVCGGACWKQELNDENNSTLLKTHTGSGLYIYPNPTLATCYVEYNSTNEASKVNVELFNILSEHLQHFTMNDGDNIQIDLSGYAAGVYFIRSFDGTDFNTIKIIKE